MNKLKLISMLTLTAMFITSQALAEGETLREKLSKGKITLTADVKGCDADAKKFCSGLKPGTQKAFMCMMAYEDQLSEACKLGITEAAMSIKIGMAAIDYSVSACETDADKLCRNVQPGDGKIVSCLRKNETKVSRACITALKETGLWGWGKN